MKHRNTTKKEFLKKLGSYSAAAGALIALGKPADAAVVPVNFDLNNTPGHQTYGLDYDGGGADINFYFYQTTYSTTVPTTTWQKLNLIYNSSGIGVTNLSFVQLGLPSWSAWPAALNSGATVGPARAFIPSPLLDYLAFTSAAPTVPALYSGNFAGAAKWGIEKFLGVKVSKGGNDYYGWIGLKLYNSGFATITRYEFNAVAGAPVTTPTPPVVAFQPVPLAPVAIAGAFGLIGLFAYLKKRKMIKTTRNS